MVQMVQFLALPQVIKALSLEHTHEASQTRRAGEAQRKLGFRVNFCSDLEMPELSGEILFSSVFFFVFPCFP